MYQWSPWPSLIQKCSPDIQKCSPDIEEFSILGHFSYARSLFCNLLSASLLSIYYVWCCKGTSHTNPSWRGETCFRLITKVHSQLIFLTITMMLYLNHRVTILFVVFQNPTPVVVEEVLVVGGEAGKRYVFFLCILYSIHSKVLASYCFLEPCLIF